MSNSDREHFDSYRLQTRTKHAILEGYLPAYFNVIKARHDNLVFIDGFAGRGHYRSGEDTFPGSPLRALDVIASSPDFAERVQCVLIEKRPEFYEELEDVVVDYFKTHPHIKEPITVQGSFSERIDKLLEEVGGGEHLAPTFLFVDPCGVEDVSLARIANVLSRDFCEVFVFFNLDGIRRIAGLAGEEGSVSPVLVDLYGSEEMATEVVEAFRATGDPAAREACLVAGYRRALREASGADFILPLRVESEHRAATSHYLLHATKHNLGFKIMKEVMWKSGGGIECEGETLALQQASRRQGQRLFRPDMDALDRDILKELTKGPSSVRVFRDEWVRRPDDMFSEAVYRKRLLALEQAGRLEVLDEDQRTVLPAESRRKYRGEPTIPERLYVRLPG